MTIRGRSSPLEGEASLATSSSRSRARPTSLLAEFASYWIFVASLLVGGSPTLKLAPPSGRTIEIFASPDKNMKQIRTELATKRLHRAMSDVVVGKGIYHNKKSGAVSIDWKPIAKVEAKPNDDFSITWNAPVVHDLGANRQLILDRFNADGPTSSGVEWSE